MELENLPERELIPGFRARFVHTDHITVAHWHVTAGSAMPEHTHPHEQLMQLVHGTFELVVEGEQRALTPGTVAVIPPHVRHGGRALTDCRIIDVFHPAREDYR